MLSHLPIDRVTLTNFKCFREISLPCRHLTVLAGVNGMGKSSVLQSLLLLRQSILGNPTGLAIFPMLLNGELVSLGGPTDILFEDAKEETIRFEIMDGSQSSFRWTAKLDSLLKTYRLTFDSIGHEAALHQSSLFTNEFQYLKAERIGPRTMYPLSTVHVRERKSLGTSGEYTAHFLATHGLSLTVPEPLLHPNGTSRSLLHQTEAWLGEISPGVRLYADELAKMDIVNLEFAFAHANAPETNRYRATNVGFGISYTLSVIVGVLSAPSGGLLILENPEAHLHPRGQVRLGNLLAKGAANGIQFIVETHSDHLLNGIRLAVHDRCLKPDAVALHYLERRSDGNGSTVELASPQMDSAGRLSFWPAGFFDEHEQALRRLLVPPRDGPRTSL